MNGLISLQEPSSSPSQSANELVSRSARSSNVVATSKAPSSVASSSPSDLRDHFNLVVFVLSQFNVHYLSWLKNPVHLTQFWYRFTPLYELLLQLPEFETESVCRSKEVNNKEEAISSASTVHEVVICEAVKDSYQYRRKLTIALSNTIGVKYYVADKKFMVLLVENEPQQTEPVQEDSDGDKSDEDSDSESVDEVEQQLKVDHMGRKVLGEIVLEEDAKTCVTLPRYTNRIKSDMDIVLVLVDCEECSGSSDSSDNSDCSNEQVEHHQIVISESSISGWKGYHKQHKFSVVCNDTLNEVELELTLKWQIDADSFDSCIRDPIGLVRKLSGAIFHLGHYYWYFCRDFYRWAATECDDIDVRYWAIQSFHELSMWLPEKVQCDDMSTIFVDMYNGRYPSPDLLSTVPKCDYLCESLSMLDNVVFVFSDMSTGEQITFLRRIQPSIGLLIESRFNFFKLLFSQVLSDMGNYTLDHIEEVVLPLAIEAIYFLATIRDPVESLQDPRMSRVDWAEVNSLAGQVTRMAVECVEHVKPIKWSMVSLEHEDMTTVKRCLQQLVRSLFNPTTAHFLRAIYITLRMKVLGQHHLASFATAHRLALIEQWCGPMVAKAAKTAQVKSNSPKSIDEELKSKQASSD